MRKERITIKDIAPNGISGGMVAKTKKPVNGENIFTVISVDFQQDLVALDTLNNADQPTWYRTEDIENIMKKI